MRIEHGCLKALDTREDNNYKINKESASLLRAARYRLEELLLLFEFFTSNDLDLVLSGSGPELHSTDFQKNDSHLREIV